MTNSEVTQLITQYIQENVQGDISAEEVAELFNAINDQLPTKANLTSGIVPTSELPEVHFQDLSGSGTSGDPYKFVGSMNVGAYLTGLPGYGANKVLFSNLTWGDVGSISPSPTPNPSVTPTRTPTPTPTATPGSTPTSTPVQSVTPTPSTSQSAIETGTLITQFTYLANMEMSGTNIIINNPAGGNGAVGLKLDPGNIGWISQKRIAFTEVGEASTGLIHAGIGLDPFYGGSDGLATVYALENGVVFGKDYQSSAGVAPINSILRIRVDINNVYTEVSTNNGSSYTTLVTVSRPAGIIRFKIGASGNQFKIAELRGFNLVTV